MKNLTVPVSEEFEDTIRRRMEEGGFGSVAEYMRHAVRVELERAERARLERLLLDGLESGEPTELTREWLYERRDTLADRVADRSAKKRR